MPELPEVQTTVNGLKKTVVGHKIIDIWSDYNSAYHAGKDNIKDRKYFGIFRKKVAGAGIIAAYRRAKNILIDLNNGLTILIHLKMTGHLLYGKYLFGHNRWQPVEPASLKDPYNRHIHLVFTLSNGKYLALSDSRKFAKVTLLDSSRVYDNVHLEDIGPEPLDNNFTLEKFLARIAIGKNKKIKQVITDQAILAGIGNIYADESLWLAGIHPLTKAKDIPEERLEKLFLAIKKILLESIGMGGDSMSDYRNIHGEKGRFQESHRAYRRTGEHCSMVGCIGIIKRIVVGGRGTHFCNVHQIKYSGK